MANNALIGNVEEVAQQMVERFHPDDRIMAWFDFQSRLRTRRYDGLHARVVPWWNPLRGRMGVRHDTHSAVQPGKPGSPCTLNHRSASRSRASPRAVKWRGTRWTTEETRPRRSHGDEVIHSLGTLLRPLDDETLHAQSLHKGT